MKIPIDFPVVSSMVAARDVDYRLTGYTVRLLVSRVWHAAARFANRTRQQRSPSCTTSMKTWGYSLARLRLSLRQPREQVASRSLDALGMM